MVCILKTKNGIKQIIAPKKEMMTFHSVDLVGQNGPMRYTENAKRSDHRSISFGSRPSIFCRQSSLSSSICFGDGKYFVIQLGADLPFVRLFDDVGSFRQTSAHFSLFFVCLPTFGYLFIYFLFDPFSSSSSSVCLCCILVVVVFFFRIEKPNETSCRCG